MGATGPGPAQAAEQALKAALGEGALGGMAQDAQKEGEFAAVGPAQEDTPLPDAPAGDATEDEVLRKTSAGYSLEQEKQHAEQDARMEAAERAKDVQRAKVSALRQRFAALRARMGEASAANKRSVLPEAELQLDKELGRLLQRRGEDSVRLVERELAYDLTRARTMLRSTRDRYQVQDEEAGGAPHDRVRGLTRSDAFVDPIRGFSIDPSLRDEPSGIAGGVGRRGASSPVGGMSSASGYTRGLQTSKAASVRFGRGQTAGGQDGDGAEAEEDTPFDVLCRGGKTLEEQRAEESGEAEIANGFKARQARRLARKAALQALLETRPGPQDRDEQEDERLAEATRLAGDMPLKEDPAYKVPRSMRASASTKEAQLRQVVTRLHDLRRAFNARVSFVRRLRARVVQAVALNDVECSRLTADIGGDPAAFRVLPRLLHVPGPEEALATGGFSGTPGAGGPGLQDDCFAQRASSASSATWASASRLLHTAAPATALVRTRGLALPALLPAAAARAFEAPSRLANAFKDAS